MPVCEVFLGATEDPQRQRIGDVTYQLAAGNLADDVFFGNRTNSVRSVGQQLNDVSQLAIVERA